MGSAVKGLIESLITDNMLSTNYTQHSTVHMQEPYPQANQLHGMGTKNLTAAYHQKMEKWKHINFTLAICQHRSGQTRSKYVKKAIKQKLEIP